MHNKYIYIYIYKKKKGKERRTKSYDIIYHMISVGSGRVPIQALSLRENWATRDELGLACILEGRPNERWGMEGKQDRPECLKGGEQRRKIVPMEKVRI